MGGRGLPVRFQLPRRREADPGRVREEHPLRAVRRRDRRPLRPARRPRSARPPPTSPSTPFTTSYARGADQEVAVTARKSLRDKELTYRVNGGRPHDEDLRAWKGGDDYGGEDNLYFDQYRAKIGDARPGDTVEAWFTGRTRSGKPTSSEHFTYTVAERPRADTLVIAEEGAPARQSAAYVDVLRAQGRTAAVWDVATRGAPHPLGVLGHFSTAVHYTGATAPGGATQLALRDFLNESGKLIEAGRRAAATSRWAGR